MVTALSPVMSAFSLSLPAASISLPENILLIDVKIVLRLKGCSSPFDAATTGADDATDTAISTGSFAGVLDLVTVDESFV